MPDQETLRILLVEDSLADRTRILGLLGQESRQSEVTTSGSLESAFAELKIGEFDVVLLDLVLPDSEGVDTCRRLCEAFPLLPVVVLTGVDDDAEQPVEALQHGAQDYLSKREMSGPLIARSLSYAVERKRLAVILHRSELRYRALVSATTSLVWSTDGRGGISADQLAWETMTGQSASETRGRGWLDAFQVSSRPQIDAVWETAIATGEPFEFEAPIRHAATKLFRLARVRGVPLRSVAGEITEWVGQLTDIEDLHRTELELRRAERLRSLGTFAAGIAHELNNPLAALWTSAEAALTRATHVTKDGTIVECLDNVVRSAERCTAIVDNVLRYSRWGAGEQPDGSLEVAARNAILLTRQFTRERGAMIEVSVEPDLPAISMNSIEIEQVFVNLIRNGIESREEGAEIRISIEKSPNGLRGVVTDNGPGMSEEVRLRAFDPFFTSRVDQTGTGLGLSIVHSIIQGHSATIETERTQGEGTTVVFTIPAF
nr:response regulator [Planctomycetota bacterium]